MAAENSQRLDTLHFRRDAESGIELVVPDYDEWGRPWLTIHSIDGSTAARLYVELGNTISPNAKLADGGHKTL